MKKIFLFFAVYFMICTCPMQAQPCTAGLSGTYTIGPGGNFTSITAAIASLQTNGLAGNVSLELQTGYTASGETYPLTFPAIPCQDLYAITLQPAAGTAGFTLTTSSSTAVLLNGIHNLIIDGRAGGTGTAKALTIESTALNGNAVTLQNDASGNTLQYLIVKSLPAAITNGIINISTTTGVTGNDSNKIRNCDIGHTTLFSTNLVYASGTTGKENNQNEISNNKLFNFFHTSLSSTGINIGQNNHAFIIDGNSFYQKTAVNFGVTYRTCYAIYINTTTGNDFIVRNNFIGGTDANCTGTQLTCSGAGAFAGINIRSGITGQSFIDNNLIANLKLTFTSNTASGAGILISGGKINCGNTTANIVGSQDSLNSISVTTTTSLNNPIANFAGIAVANGDTVVVTNNTIGGIAGGGTGRLSVFGILLTGSTSACYTVSNNIIGNPALANSITNWATSTSLVHGINSAASSAARTQTFSSNQVINLNCLSTSSSSQVAGIYTAAGQNSIVNNIVHDIFGASSAAASNAAAVTGISCVGGFGTQRVTGNTVYKLISNSVSASPSVIGIYACNGSSASLPVNKNLVHSLTATGSGNVTLTGIYAACFSTFVNNNMVRLGIDIDGNAVNGNYAIHGIYQGLLSTGHTISFNSVYIGGSSSGSQHTYAFYNLDSLVAKNISNNIFVNARSTSSGTGKNYAVQLRGNKKKPQGLAMTANLYFASGTAGFIGFFNGNSCNSFSEWREITGVDSLSGKGDPGFINATGNLSAINLHLNAVTPAESAGIADSLVVDDFDNENRAIFTPADIGADAGNFTAVDVIAPTIAYSVLLNNTTNLSNRSIQVRIADAGTGVHISGAFVPRLWLRRSSPFLTNWASTPGTLISGNSGDGVWEFVIDYSILGITPAGPEMYEYYVTAQDIAANVEISPAVGGAHSDVNTQVAAPTNGHSYRVMAIVPPLVNVGTGEQFPTLTGNNGLFQFLRENVMSSNVTVNITSDLSEDGTFALDADSMYNYQLKLTPANPTTKVIANSGDLPFAMLRLFNMSNIIFDGSYGGTGKYLRFRNSHTIPESCNPVFLLDSTSSNIVISHCIIESNIRDVLVLKASILVGSAGVNKQLEFSYNHIKDAEVASGTPVIPKIAVRSASNNNKLLTIRGNEIYNFSYRGIDLMNTGDSCRIDSNHFYYNATISTPEVSLPIYIQNGSGHTISKNYIGGSAPFCGGSQWWFTPVSSISDPASFAGIYYFLYGARPSMISDNTIQNIFLNPTTEGQLRGIEAWGNPIVINNIIGHPSSPDNIVNSGKGTNSFTYGLSVSATDSTSVMNNTIANISATGLDSCRIVGIKVSGGREVIKNNIIHTLKTNSNTGGGGQDPTAGGIFIWLSQSGSEIDNNLIYNIKALNTYPKTRLSGIEMILGAQSRSLIRGNRVYNLENRSDSGLIFGILMSGLVRSENNQITIINGTNTNRVGIYGIRDGSDSAYHFYNTVYISGTAVSGNINSYAYQLYGGRLIRLQNNILYNGRTGGSGGHYSVGATVNPDPTPRWAPISSNYNLFVANDSAKIGAWGINEVPQSMIGWKAISGGDSISLATLALKIPASIFFRSIASGDLNINNNDSICWYVNGKGLPVSTISGDFDSISNIRSTSVVTGPTDIGSDEFNTTTTPGPLEILGRHLPGMTDSLMLNGRVLATITWGNTGTLPTIGNARFYSGEWPNDLTNAGTVVNARTLNGWLQIPVTGGAGYTYSITYYYDSSMLGRVQDLSKLTLHKRNIGETGSWQMLSPTTINISAKTATAVGLTSFSEFSGAESNAPLALPGDNACPGGTVRFTNSITGAGYTYQWQADDGNGFVNVINNSIYSGVNSTTLVITGAPSAYNRYKYRCVVNTGSGTANSDEFLLKITSSWKGTVDSDWNNPLNWSCEQVPDANTDVLIGTGLVNYPVITTNVICRSIIASSGSLIQVNSGAAIELTGK
ncbi:MAG: right-handed parallel beta-helix repeat-containing protein [Chitinophagaceae bacterium]|nr:right-handed parallel beta-helix repeat-containing protein [Chitinophagaceae bacterium]